MFQTVLYTVIVVVGTIVIAGVAIGHYETKNEK